MTRIIVTYTNQHLKQFIYVEGLGLPASQYQKWMKENPTYEIDEIDVSQDGRMLTIAYHIRDQD